MADTAQTALSAKSYSDLTLKMQQLEASLAKETPLERQQGKVQVAQTLTTEPLRAGTAGVSETTAAYIPPPQTSATGTSTSNGEFWNRFNDITLNLDEIISILGNLATKANEISWKVARAKIENTLDVWKNQVKAGEDTAAQKDNIIAAGLWGGISNIAGGTAGLAVTGAGGALSRFNGLGAWSPGLNTGANLSFGLSGMGQGVGQLGGAFPQGDQKLQEADVSFANAAVSLFQGSQTLNEDSYQNFINALRSFLEFMQQIAAARVQMAQSTAKA